LVQSLLNRIGYDAGPVDGFYGTSTTQAVMAYQRANGLVPDGIVGPSTWNSFEKILRGYDIYKVASGDTLYSIAGKYYTTVGAINTANPGLNATNLQVGSRIIVPYGIDVVFTDVDYTYGIMEMNIMALKARYPFLQTGVTGKSVMGKNLYYIKLGVGSNHVLYNAAHHANEWITSPLLMKFIEDFLKAYSSGGSLRGYNAANIWSKCSIYLIPMVNPDGVDLVLFWPNYTDPAYTTAAALNKTGRPLPQVWKANIRGVDLNVNYPALWDKEKQMEIEQGVTGPAPRDYGGKTPLSEPESRAMADFTKNSDFRLVIAYHTQGGVIYWQFENLAPPVSLQIARLFAKVSGYTVSLPPGEAAYAGYKDWFIQDFRKPGYTIEVGHGVNPIPISQFPEIYNANEEILLLGGLV